MHKSAEVFIKAVMIICLIQTAAWCKVPIDPLPWNPPKRPPMEGVYVPNEDLLDAELIGAGLLNGPEAVAIDEEGRLYVGSADGVIHRVWPDGQVEVFASTGGHPLGLDFDTEGNLIVCEPTQGLLLSIDPEGNVTILTQQANGTPLNFVEDVDVASDGMIYFSDASDKFAFGQEIYDFLEARPHGRLLQYNPQTEETEILLDGLYFANGVALSMNEDFLLVNETSRYRITRYWLKGELAGTAEIFAENLPGLPDGISSNGNGTFWIAYYIVRSVLTDGMHPYPYIKALASLLPLEVWYILLEPYGFVVGMDEEGEPFVSYQDPEGGYLSYISSVEEYEGFLYLGTARGSVIGRLVAP
jgi:sugar lactone lactonase YvrE